MSGPSIRVEVAGNFLKRGVGLLGRAGLAEDAGLFITPCPSVHTCFMRFAIDVVFVDRAGTIVRIVPRVPPWRFAGAKRAYACLELAAGAAERFGLEVGQNYAALANPGSAPLSITPVLRGR